MAENEFLHIFRSHAAARNGFFRNHRHSAFEISLILSGEGKYRTDNRIFDIESGDIFLYHTNEPHCITDIYGTQEMEILNIHFEPRYLWTFSEDMKYLQTIFRRSTRADNRIPSGDPLNSEVCTLMLDAQREYERRDAGYERLLHGDILKILILLARNENAVIPEGSTDSETLSKINGSMDYICEHFSEPITLRDIAATAGLCRTYYCSVFKELNGMTPWDYVNIKRIEHAMHLLRESDNTILNIALQSGFNNTANFNRIFKNVTGLTPRDYRRTKRGDGDPASAGGTHRRKGVLP